MGRDTPNEICILTKSSLSKSIEPATLMFMTGVRQHDTNTVTAIKLFTLPPRYLVICEIKHKS